MQILQVVWSSYLYYNSVYHSLEPKYDKVEKRKGGQTLRTCCGLTKQEQASSGVRISYWLDDIGSFLCYSVASLQEQCSECDN